MLAVPADAPLYHIAVALDELDAHSRRRGHVRGGARRLVRVRVRVRARARVSVSVSVRVRVRLLGLG